MTGNAPYKTLRLGKSGKVALVDAEDYPRVCRWKWYFSKGHVLRLKFPKVKSYNAVRLSHEVLELPLHVRVRYINGNNLDCRRANLQPLYGCVTKIKGRRRGAYCYRAVVVIDQVGFYVGVRPTREEAEQIARIAGEVGAQLRGRGLTRKRIQWQLDLATGRAGHSLADDGAELMQQIRAALPVNLSPDVRDEAAQEIALAVMSGQITPDEVSEPGALRGYLRSGAGLARLTDARHISLDHHITDGLRLIDVLAA
jgi:hypothetical protein